MSKGFLASNDGVRNLKDQKTRKKCTYKRIALEANVTLEQVKRLFNPHWGKGRYKLGTEIIEKIADALDLKPKDIVGDSWYLPVVTPEAEQINIAVSRSNELDYDNKLIVATRELLSLIRCEEEPLEQYNDDNQSRQNIKNLCNDAFHESGIYKIIQNIIGPYFAAYVLAYIMIDRNRSIPITVAIKNASKKEYLINRVVNRIIESSEINESSREEVEEDVRNSEEDDTHFGQWLLKHPPFLEEDPLLGVLAILNKQGEQFRDLSKEDSFSNYPAFISRDDNPPLVYAIEVPGKYNSELIENNTMPLKESLGITVVEGRDNRVSYLEAMNKWAEVVATTDYLGQDREISEVLFIPILLNPRINLLLMPKGKVKIPRNLAGLLLLRHCAELFHSKFFELLLKGG